MHATKVSLPFGNCLSPGPNNQLGIPATAVTNRQGLLIRLLITLWLRVISPSAGYSVPV